MPWILWVGPECHHKCLYKIEAKGVIEGGKEEVKTEPRNANSYEELTEARKGFSPRAFRESMALLTS